MDFFTNFQSRINSIRSSNAMAIAIVYATLMVDNMLMTAVVPILPEYFFKKHAEELDNFQVSNSTFTPHSMTGSNSQSEVFTIMPTAAVMNQVTLQNTSNETTTAKLSSKCKTSKETAYLAHENLYIGILFASKPIVQIVANAAVGPVSDRIGYDVPMFAGYLIMCLSSVMFALGTNYPTLMAARAIQGIGSACASTAGMGMLADRYTDDEKRGRAIGIALGGLAMGVLTGPTFGSAVYAIAGKEAVFLSLAGLSVIIGMVQLMTRQMNVQRREPGEEGTPLTTLLRDPYIILVAATITLGTMSIGVLEAGQPIWMITTMCSPPWALGVAFLPESLSYLASTNLSAIFCQRIPRWLLCIIGLNIIVAGCIWLPFSRSLPELILPGALIGSAAGMVDTSMFPVMANLVDTRHTPVYGSVFAIADVSFCIAFVVGPLGAGAIISVIGFKWLMWIVAIITFIFAPLVLFLRKPIGRAEESIPILNHTPNDDNEVFNEPKNGNMVDSP